MKLPVVSGQRVIKALLRKGYYIRNQKGSHVHLRHPERIPVTVPDHKVIAKGTLKEIIKVTGLRASEL